MDYSLKFQRSDGSSPLNYFLQIENSVRPTDADMLAIGNQWRTHIVERTLAGNDADNSPFAPYSEKSKYYFNPSNKAGRGRVPIEKQKAAAKRLFKKVQKGNPDQTPHLSRTGRSIVFASYGAFKRWLGRTNVDLFGPQGGSHMLQSIYVRSDGNDSVTLGIYGEPAARASGHNEGILGRLPQRRFFGADEEMMTGAKTLLSTSIRARLNT